jgi:hypothetical protein
LLRRTRSTQPMTLRPHLLPTKLPFGLLILLVLSACQLSASTPDPREPLRATPEEAVLAAEHVMAATGESLQLTFLVTEIGTDSAVVLYHRSSNQRGNSLFLANPERQNNLWFVNCCASGGVSLHSYGPLKGLLETSTIPLSTGYGFVGHRVSPEVASVTLRLTSGHSVTRSFTKEYFVIAIPHDDFQCEITLFDAQDHTIKRAHIVGRIYEITDHTRVANCKPTHLQVEGTPIRR